MNYPPKIRLNVWAHHERVVIPKEIIGSEIIVLVHEDRIIEVLDNKGYSLDGFFERDGFTWEYIKEYVEAILAHTPNGDSEEQD